MTRENFVEKKIIGDPGKEEVENILGEDYKIFVRTTKKITRETEQARKANNWKEVAKLQEQLQNWQEKYLSGKLGECIDPKKVSELSVLSREMIASGFIEVFNTKREYRLFEAIPPFVDWGERATEGAVKSLGVLEQVVSLMKDIPEKELGENLTKEWIGIREGIIKKIKKELFEKLAEKIKGGMSRSDKQRVRGEVIEEWLQNIKAPEDPNKLDPVDKIFVELKEKIIEERERGRDVFAFSNINLLLLRDIEYLRQVLDKEIDKRREKKQETLEEIVKASNVSKDFFEKAREVAKNERFF